MIIPWCIDGTLCFKQSRFGVLDGELPAAVDDHIVATIGVGDGCPELGVIQDGDADVGYRLALAVLDVAVDDGRASELDGAWRYARLNWVGSRVEPLIGGKCGGDNGFIDG